MQRSEDECDMRRFRSFSWCAKSIIAKPCFGKLAYGRYKNHYYIISL